MTGNAPEISPDSWEYRLVAAVIHSVERRAGARSWWNGRLLDETDPDDLGAAHPDGSLSASVRHVLEPLRQARDLDRPLTEDEAWELREAIATLTHEAAHLLARSDDPAAPEAYPFDDSAVAFDEGRIELWTHENLDLVINDVFTDAGLAKVEAAVLAESSLDAYPAYTSAVRYVDEALAERSALTSAEVTQKLMRAGDNQRWNVAVDLVIDERLVKPGLMPEAHRAAVRKQLVAPLRAGLAGLAAVEADESLESPQTSEKSVKAAQHAVAGLDQALGTIERDYRMLQQVQQQSQRPQEAVRQARQQLPPDLDRLQAMTRGQAPAAGAANQPVDVTGSAPPERDGRFPRRDFRPHRGGHTPQSPDRG